MQTRQICVQCLTEAAESATEPSLHGTIGGISENRTNFAVNAETKNFRFGAHLGFEWGNEERQSFSGGVKASYLF